MDLSIVDLVINNEIELLKNYNNTQEYNRGLIYACLYGYFDLVKLMIEKLEKVNKKIHLLEALIYSVLGACGDSDNTHIEIAKFIISKTPLKLFNVFHCSCLLQTAAQSGNLEMVKFIADRGSDLHTVLKLPKFPQRYDWSDTIQQAAKYGHLDLVEFIENKVSFSYEKWEKLLYKAVESGNMKIFQLAFSHYNDFDSWDLLRHAALGGNMDIIELIIDKKIIKTPNYWNKGLDGAAEGGHLELVQFFIDKGAWDYNTGLIQGAFSGNIEIVQLMIDKLKAPTWGSYCNWNNALIAAVKSSNIEIVQLIINNAGNKITEWDICLEWAARNGDLEIIKQITKQISEDQFQKMIPRIIKKAASYGHKNIIQFFKEPVPEYEVSYDEKRIFDKYRKDRICRILISFLCEDILYEIFEYIKFQNCY